MDRNLHDIDKLFYDSVEPHEEAPSAKVWDEIDKNLTRKGFTSYKKKYDRLKWLLLLLLLTTAGLFTYLLKENRSHRYKNSDINNTANNNISKPTPPANKEQGLNSHPTNQQTGGPDSQKSPQETQPSTVNNIVDDNKLTLPSGDKKSPTSADNIKEITTASNTDKTNSRSGKSTSGEKNNTTAGKSNDVPTKSASLFSDNAVITSGGGGKTSKLKKEKPGQNKTSPENHLQDNNIKNTESDPTTITEDPYTVFSVRKQDYPLDRLAGAGMPALDNRLTGIDLSATPLADAAQRKRAAGLKRIQRGTAVSIIPYFMPLFSTLHIEDGHHIHREDDRDAIRGRENDSKGKPLMSFGMLAQVSLIKRMSLQTGAGFYSSTTQIQQQTIYARQNPNRAGENAYKFNCTAGTVYFNTKTLNTNPVNGDSLEALNPSFKLNYMQIPLTFQYNILNKNKLTLFANAGIFTNILVKSNVALTLTNGNAKETVNATSIDGLRKVNYSWVLGAGVEYRLNNKLSLYGDLNSNTSLTPINKNTPVKTNVSNAGIQMGIKIRL